MRSGSRIVSFRLVVTVLLSTQLPALAADSMPAPGRQSANVAQALPSNMICRSAYFWGTRGGFENNHANITQAVLDSTGGRSVCGHSITTTSRAEQPWMKGLGLSSALEGLCVRVQGKKIRQLYRQLLATSLNCALSGADDCDEEVQAFVDVGFSECNSLCAGNPGADSPSVSKCIHQLRCFNVGGRLVEGGKCAIGTCASQASLYCGVDFGACPLINDKHQSCRKFAGNCLKPKLCQESLGICPKNTLRSSRFACQEAGHDDCTIDSCPD